MADPFIAEIVMFGSNFAPRGWANCDGQLLPISQYSALFSLLGTTYGGDGRTTFALPDMRGRVPIHPGHGPGLSNYSQGPGGGRESVTLTVPEMPAHNHAGQVAVANPTFTGGTPSNSPSNAQFSSPAAANMYVGDGTPSRPMASNNFGFTTGNSGGNQSFSVVQPWCSVRFIIALQGVFPSRS